MAENSAALDLGLIRQHERTLGGFQQSIADQLAGALPSFISNVPGFSILPSTAQIDLLKWEGDFKTQGSKVLLTAAEQQQVGGQSIGEMISEAVRSVIAKVYEWIGPSDQYTAGKQVLAQLSNGAGQLDEGLASFHASLPKNLQPSEKLLAGFVASGIMDATQSIGAIGKDAVNSGTSLLYSQTGTPGAFDAGKASSEHIAAKVYDSVYSGMVIHYVNQGISEDDARKYATAVAQEVSGMKLQRSEKGEPVVVPGDNGGIRKYFQETIAAGKDGRDISTITLDASTPESLKALKLADAAMQPSGERTEGTGTPAVPPPAREREPAGQGR